MRKYRLFLWSALVVIVLVWLASLAAIPPLDFDEALYRRTAEELGRGASDAWLVPRWDGRPVFDKPPTYLWVIRASSAIWDSGSGVGTFAARFSGWFFSLLTVLTLAFSWPALAKGALKRYATPSQGQSAHLFAEMVAHPAIPVIFYALCALPAMGASLVLLDPMLTACFTVSLVIFTRVWVNGDDAGHPQPFTLSDTLAVGLSLGAATCVKGLIGVLLPGFAVALQLAVCAAVATRRGTWSQMVVGFSREFWGRSLILARQMGPAFALAIGCGTLFYGVIWMAGGQEFVREFFLTHHFRRGSAAMEGHSGPIYYHFLVVLLGGFPLTFYAFAKRAGRRVSLRVSLFFPWAWLSAFVIFFSLMATKLPNYMWPVWPALVLGVGFLVIQKNVAVFHGRQWMANLFPVVGGLVFLLLSFVPLALRFLAPHVDGRARIILEAMGTPSLGFYVAAVLAGSLFLTSCLLVRAALLLGGTKGIGRLVAAALALAGFEGALGWGVVPLGIDTFVRPLERLAQRASESPYAAMSLTTWGLRSPTVSSHYQGVPEQFSGRHTFEGVFPPLVLMPAWKFEACLAQGHEVKVRDGYAGLCVDSMVSVPGLP